MTFGPPRSNVPSSSIAASITASIATRGGYTLAAQTYELDGPIYVPSRAKLEAVPGAVLRCGGDYPAVVVADGPTGAVKGSRAVVAGFKITRTNTAGSPSTAQTSSDGVVVNCDGALLEDLEIEECWNGVRTVDIADTLSGTTQSTSANHATVENSKTATLNQYAGYYYLDNGQDLAYPITGNTAGAGFTLTVAANGITPTNGAYEILPPLPATPAISDLHIVNVKVKHSNLIANASLYGYQFNDVYGLVMRDSNSEGTKLEGLKVRRSCQDTLIDGGLFTGALQGGVNLFGGGGYTTLRNVRANANAIGAAFPGILVKSSGLTRAFGNMRHTHVIDCTARGNGGGGLRFGRDVTGLNQPTISLGKIRGGVYDSNDNVGGNQAGISIAGWTMEIDGPSCINNVGAGLWLRSDSTGCTSRGGVYVANGSGLGIKCNVLLDGTRNRVERPILRGKDGLDYYDDTTFDALTAVSEVGVLVNGTAVDCSVAISDSDSRGHSTNDQVQVASGGKCTVDYIGTGVPTGGGASTYRYGGPGSTYRRRDGGANTSFYIKQSVDHDPTGWSAVTP